MKIFKFLVLSFVILSVFSCKEDNSSDLSKEIPFEDKPLKEKIIGKWNHTTIEFTRNSVKYTIPFPGLTCGNAHIEINEDNTYYLEKYDTANNCSSNDNAGNYTIEGKVLTAHPTKQGLAARTYTIDNVTGRTLTFVVGDKKYHFIKEKE